jgi:hypothetical protein
MTKKEHLLAAQVYRGRVNFEIEDPGAKSIVDELNATMYSTSPAEIRRLYDRLREYKKSFREIKLHDPGFIIAIERNMMRDTISKKISQKAFM